MMCCSTCPFNRVNYSMARENPGLASGPLGGMFFCSSPRCPQVLGASGHAFQERFCSDCPHSGLREICRQDAYVLATIAEEDEFSLQTAHHTLDTLVQCGNGHFLSELFRCAPMELRGELWNLMTSCHPDRINLLNELFEKDELPPLENGEWPSTQWRYRDTACGSVAGNTVFPITPAQGLSVRMAVQNRSTRATATLGAEA